uniref:Vps54_N domain-containing protein n=1 Tax=Parastrongyloides trichosuri TaxID=131310 RepID=A0A0N4ZNS1_PARTI
MEKDTIDGDKEDIYENIEAAYFIEDDFMHVDFELRKLTTNGFNLENIIKEKNKLRKELTVINKKISEEIKEHNMDFTGEMEKIYGVKEEVSVLLEVITDIRLHLSHHRCQTEIGLKIVANDRKKKLLTKLKLFLLKIKRIREYSFILEDLINEHQFKEALKLFDNTMKCIEKSSNIIIINKMKKTFQEIMEQIETKLEDALASIVIQFDEEKFYQCIYTYKILGKLSVIPDKIVSFYKAAIETSARSKIYLVLNKHFDNIKIMDNESYEMICEKVNSEILIETLIEICVSFVEIFISYHEMIKYCRNNENITEDDFIHSLDSKMSVYCYNFFKISANKINILLACNDMSYVKFDTFLEIVEYINIFKEFGRKYFGYNCVEIAMTLDKQILVYFQRYHKERLEELKLFLENEMFTPVPVSFQFTIFDLQEFQFLKDERYSLSGRKIEKSFSDVNIGEQLEYELIPDYFLNPFSIKEKSPTKQRVFSNLGEVNDICRSPDVTDELKINAPILCNTTLSLMKLLGKYIKASLLFPCIAENVVESLIELFYYHLILVHDLFINDTSFNNIDFEKIFTFKSEDYSSVERMIANIKDSLIEDFKNNSSSSSTNNSPLKRIQSKDISFVENLNHISNTDNCHCIQERIVAIESIIFMSKQLDLIHPVIDSFLFNDESINFESKKKYFFDILLPSLSKFRDKGFAIIACNFINYEELLRQINNTKWDVKELISEHNYYIDFLLSEFERFSNIINQLSLAMRVPIHTKNNLWNSAISLIFKILVQGYCESSKKCTNEGRALMQLDFQQLIFKMENESTEWNREIPKPIYFKSYVDNFIKAYYLPESTLEQWIIQHKEYSSIQVSHLLNTASHISKKAKSRILNKLNI